jgi:serine protease Do
MNNRNIWMMMGLGAMAAALVALPGSSAHKQEPHSSVLAGQEACLGDPEELVRSQANQENQSIEDFALAAQESARDAMGEIRLLSQGDDDNIQVIVGGSGSWLGVGVTEVTEAKAKDLKLPAERGALLGKIVPDSPAAKAGLKENDVVTEINGTRVEGAEQFRRMIHEIPAGRTAQLTVWRDGRAQTVAVTLAKSEFKHPHAMTAPAPGAFAFRMPEVTELPEVWDQGDFNNFAFTMPGHFRLGIDAEDLEGDLGIYFGAPGGEGVLVRNVFAGTPAAKAGLKAGDVITSFNGERIRNIGDLHDKLMGGKDLKSVKLGLLRNKSELAVTVEMPEAPSKQKAHISQRRSI